MPKSVAMYFVEIEREIFKNRTAYLVISWIWSDYTILVIEL